MPQGLPGANTPLISPYFADVDTRNAASGVLHLRNDVANQTILTWDTVGYFNSRGNLLNTFQLIVRGPGYVVPVGEGTIGFFYQEMPWIDTDTSNTAAVGFGDGAGNSISIQGSNTSTINAPLQDHYICFNQNLTPVPPVNPIPEPETYALMLVGLGMLGAMARRKRAPKTA